MTQNLFEQTNDDIDPGKSYLEELVGDGKKFKSIEDLAKGKYLSDKHIPILERENEELRSDYIKLKDEYNAGQKLQELIDKLALKQQEQASNEMNPLVNDVKTPAITPEDIDNRVASKFQEIEASKRQQENYMQVMGKLQERYGNNYKNILREQTNNLGLQDDYVNNLALNYPSVFIKTFDLDVVPNQNADFLTPAKSQMRSDNFAPRTQKRTWSYYEKMRKDDPKSYSRPQTQAQMHTDANELGDAFKDGSWNS